jgi:hypothetical protein
MLHSEWVRMSKKKTPQEKKEAAYNKDHYTFAWKSPHGFRKTWKRKKSYRNRMVRRKAKSLLHTIEDYSLSQLGPEEESLTSELFRKGLGKKGVRKRGVLSLRRKVALKKEGRNSPGETRRERKERLAIEYAAAIVAFERAPSSAAAQKLVGDIKMGIGSLCDFLTGHPYWKMRLHAKIDKLNRQEQLSLERARS